MSRAASAENLARLTVLVRGRVQGVCFRAAAAAEARALGLRGLARNRPDGAVAIVAEGNTPQLTRFLAWTRIGPPRARVDEVSAEWGPATGAFDDFAIA